MGEIFNNLQVGKKYLLRNYSQTLVFRVQEIEGDNIIVTDLFTLESYPLDQAITGTDLDIREI